MARTLPSLGLISALLSSHLAWANPDEVRHAGDMPMYASLEMSGVRPVPTNLNPLAPPPPAESHAQSRLVQPAPKPLPRPRRWGLFGAGVALFGVAYAADAGVTYGMNHASPGTSLIPLAGPLLQIGQHYSVVSVPASTGDAAVDAMAQSAANGVNHTVQVVVTAGLVIDFAMQLAGLAMIIAGPASHRGAESPKPQKLAFAPGGLRVTF